MRLIRARRVIEAVRVIRVGRVIKAARVIRAERTTRYNRAVPIPRLASPGNNRIMAGDNLPDGQCCLS
jgi:hypothetical protein